MCIYKIVTFLGEVMTEVESFGKGLQVPGDFESSIMVGQQGRDLISKWSVAEAKIKIMECFGTGYMIDSTYNQMVLAAFRIRNLLRLPWTNSWITS